jgi:hypothetical protein
MVPHSKTDKLGRMAEKALKEAVKKALKLHQELKVPAVYMLKGKMVYLTPDGREISKPPVRKNGKK